MKNFSAKNITISAMTAALYIVLTLVSNAFGLANGLIQLRLSEILVLLPVFTPAAVPGLFAGCLLANILTGALLPDVIFGSLATLLGAMGTLLLKRNRVLSVCAPILSNTLIIPVMMYYTYGIRPVSLSFACIFLSELISAGFLGTLFLKALQARLS